ncbi:uncharacterized protein N7477_000521 [Penicillium maclennaniae]|uniref:uncharacterized protein n=1 Tax=Penicillium maclennaniae TaxID=1343394 RepID=UPI002540841D|nr:uncharacterized protein N7477_000521 [Penicillium maclennaniae]KAJ5684176.1 hypothetical protein N7477_000521 [Penicillium maclennaniae]
MVPECRHISGTLISTSAIHWPPRGVNGPLMNDTGIVQSPPAEHPYAMNGESFVVEQISVYGGARGFGSRRQGQRVDRLDPQER